MRNCSKYLAHFALAQKRYGYVGIVFLFHVGACTISENRNALGI